MRRAKAVAASNFLKISPRFQSKNVALSLPLPSKTPQVYTNDLSKHQQFLQSIGNNTGNPYAKSRTGSIGDDDRKLTVARNPSSGTNLQMVGMALFISQAMKNDTGNAR